MAKVKHESKASKAAPEKSEAEKRRDRREARKARAAKAADASKGQSGSIDLRGSADDASGRSDSPSVVEPIVVSAAKEKRPRFKIVITNDDLIKATYDTSNAKIELCDDHHDALLKKFELHGIRQLVTSNEEKLILRLQKKRVEPMFHACDALIKVATTTVGSAALLQYRCPVCALSKFDYLAPISRAMKNAITKQNEVKEQSHG